MLNIRDIKSALGENKAEIIFKEVTESTNDDLKKLASDNMADNTVIIALKQTSGRGRLGRSFYSPDNSGIYMSCFIKPEIDEEDIVLLTSSVAVSVARAIEKNTEIIPEIKWVNDIYCKNKKLCGILLEAVRNKDNKLIGIVVGVGLNCIRGALPAELQDIVGYLSDFCDCFDVNKLTADIIEEIYNAEELIKSKTLVGEYRKRSCVIGKTIDVIGDTVYKGYAVDIDERCGLIVRKEDGTVEILSTGEISIRIDK